MTNVTVKLQNLFNDRAARQQLGSMTISRKRVDAVAAVSDISGVVHQRAALDEALAGIPAHDSEFRVYVIQLQGAL